MPDQPLILTARELATRLRMTVQQVYRLSASGLIPKFKAGHRTVRFDLSEVLAALRAPVKATSDACTRSTETTAAAGGSAGDDDV